MSRSRKRVAAADSDEEEDDLWAEEDEPQTTKPAKKRTKQASLIEDVVAGDDGGEEGGDGGRDDDDLSDGYDSELYGDEADRAHLDSLPELEREKILFQRAEKRQELLERREAKRRAQASSSYRHMPTSGVTRGRTRGSTAAKKGGSSLPDALADLIARKHHKTTSKPSDSIVFEKEEGEDELEEQLAERAAARTRRGRRRKHDRMDTDEDDEDTEAEPGAGEAAEEDEQDKARRRHEARFSIPGSHTPLRLTDMKMIQLRRDRLERVHDEPYFPDVVKGMFVRVTVGQDTRRGVPKYRVGEVVEVGELRAKYPFPPGTTRSTKLGLVLRRGTAERLFAMSAVSNQGITEDEFAEFVGESKKAGVQVITAEEALERKKRVEYVKDTYVYTPELVAKMLEEKRGRGKHINVTIERTKMDIELQRARSAVDVIKLRMRTRATRREAGDAEQDGEGEAEREDEEALRVEEARLEAVENKLAELTELELKQSKQRDRSDVNAILNVNKKNQEHDIAAQRDMFIQQERQRREEEERMRREGRKREVTLDPFKRRATRPSMNFDDEDAAKDDSKDERKEAKDVSAHAEAKVVGAEDEDCEAEAKTAPAVTVPVSSGLFVSGGGKGLLSFPHPPSLSELMLRQLQLSHQQGGAPDVDVQRSSEVGGSGRGAAGGGGASSLYGGKVWSDEHSVLKHNERVLSVSEYWARREQA